MVVDESYASRKQQGGRNGSTTKAQAGPREGNGIWRFVKTRIKNYKSRQLKYESFMGFRIMSNTMKPHRENKYSNFPQMMISEFWWNISTATLDFVFQIFQLITGNSEQYFLEWPVTLTCLIMLFMKTSELWMSTVDDRTKTVAIVEDDYCGGLHDRFTPNSAKHLYKPMSVEL